MLLRGPTTSPGYTDWVFPMPHRPAPPQATQLQPTQESQLTPTASAVAGATSVLLRPELLVKDPPASAALAAALGLDSIQQLAALKSAQVLQSLLHLAMERFGVAVAGGGSGSPPEACALLAQALLPPQLAAAAYLMPHAASMTLPDPTMPPPQQQQQQLIRCNSSGGGGGDDGGGLPAAAAAAAVMAPSREPTPRLLSVGASEAAAQLDALPPAAAAAAQEAAGLLYRVSDQLPASSAVSRPLIASTGGGGATTATTQGEASHNLHAHMHGVSQTVAAAEDAAATLQALSGSCRPPTAGSAGCGAGGGSGLHRLAAGCVTKGATTTSGARSMRLGSGSFRFTSAPVSLPLAKAAGSDATRGEQPSDSAGGGLSQQGGGGGVTGGGGYALGGSILQRTSSCALAAAGGSAGAGVRGGGGHADSTGVSPGMSCSSAAHGHFLLI